MTDSESPMIYHPGDAASDLDSRARERFKQKVGEYGAGKNWRGCGDGEMARQAHAKILEAQDLVAYDRPDEALTALADALNYLRFEADNIRTFSDWAEMERDSGGGE